MPEELSLLTFAYSLDDKAVEPTRFMKDIFAHLRFYWTAEVVGGAQTVTSSVDLEL